MDYILAIACTIWFWSGYGAIIIKHPRPPHWSKWVLFLTLGPLAYLGPSERDFEAEAKEEEEIRRTTFTLGEDI